MKDFTEICREQTISAAKRYEDEGIKQYMILGREETDHCGYDVDCRKMDGKIFNLTDMIIGKNAPPFHPNCRCSIKAMMNDEFLRKRQEENRKIEQEKRAKQREANELKRQAEQLRTQARQTKADGDKELAKKLEAEARILEKRYKQIFAELCE
jgi:hypothetical protein